MSTILNNDNISDEEKAKVAYALNLCAASITQIIDSKDIIVLRQEREFILGNLNLQNFVKHPALLDVIKKILNALTYFEIQAGDQGFVEKEYQQKLKNAIWSAVPSPSILFAGGDPVTLAIGVAAQIGIGYMNYRKNKNQYLLDKEKSEWELRKHEIEQLSGLRSLLFETAWRLSADYDFDDKLRLTERQISRYSAALFESDPLKRFERLDVMSEKFGAFPPFWYHKGNAAMEVLHDKRYSAFATIYRDVALKAYSEFHKRHFEFLREDVIAASCCFEHISLLAPNDAIIEELLRKAMRLAGDNYDVLQQCIFVNLQLKRFDDVVTPLREMIANDYNVGLNGILLSRIYFTKSNKIEYEKLCAIAGEENILPWSDNADLSEKLLLDARKSNILDEYLSMIKRIVFRLKNNKLKASYILINNGFSDALASVQKYTVENETLSNSFVNVKRNLEQIGVNASESKLRDFFNEAHRLGAELLTAEFSMQIAEDAPKLIDKMREVAK